MTKWRTKALSLFVIVFFTLTAFSLVNSIPYTSYPLDYPYNIESLNYSETNQENITSLIFLQLGLSVFLVGSAIVAYSIWAKKKTQSIPKMLLISLLGTALTFIISAAILLTLTHFEDFNGLVQTVILIQLTPAALLIATVTLLIQQFQANKLVQAISKHCLMIAVILVLFIGAFVAWDHASCGTQFGLISKFNGDCLAQKAVELQDSSMCEKTDDVYREKSACYLYVSIINQKNDLCEKIPNRKLQQTCLEESAPDS